LIRENPLNPRHPRPIEVTIMATISGGHLMARSLKQEGIGAIFTLCGGHGEHVTELGQIRPALERAHASSKPALVNVMVGPDVFSSGTRNQSMYK
jgi:thiamine pyrophosphate-dependent acetolactate synthase large subunit-like protein